MRDSVVIGDRLRAVRELRRESQAQAAHRIGISANALCQYEKNDRRPTYTVLIRIARHYRVSTDYLLGLELDLNLRDFSLSEDEIKAVEAFLITHRSLQKTSSFQLDK